MSESVTNQINLKPQEKEEVRVESAQTATNGNDFNQNPPLIDYMQPTKNKNNVILFGLIAIFGLIILVIVGGYIFRYFASQNDQKASNPQIVEEIAKVEILENEDSTTENDENIGFVTIPGYMTPEKEDFDGILISPAEIANYNKNGSQTTVKPTDPLTTDATMTNPNNAQNTTNVNTVNPSTVTSEPITATQAIDKMVTAWKANNYTAGDIKGNTHTVIIGDTLWEISEGKYGQGQQWRKIQSANDIKNLPNGNPLIIPGQNLNLPQ